MMNVLLQATKEQNSMNGDGMYQSYHGNKLLCYNVTKDSNPRNNEWVGASLQIVCALKNFWKEFTIRYVDLNGQNA